MPVKRALLYLLCIHLLVLFLQLPLRAVLIDTTFWRDAVLLLTCGLWGILVLMSARAFSVRGLDLAMAALLGYGVLLLLIGIAVDGQVTSQLLGFRNYFLPLLLYFPARQAFSVARHQRMFVNIVFLFFALFLVTPLLEFAYSLTSLPMRWIPWYSYAFDHDYRFLGNSDSAYLDPNDTPLLGLLGYPHYSAPALVAMFAFVLPLLGSRVPRDLGGRLRHLNALSKVPPVAYLLMFGLVIVLFGVRTQMMSALVVLFVLPSPRKGLKWLGYATVAALVTVVAFPEQAASVGVRFAAGFVSEGGGPSALQLILSLQELLFISTSPFPQLVLGHGVAFDAVGSGQWELRALYFTARLGVFWLILFGTLLTLVFRGVRHVRRGSPKLSFEYRVAQGCLGMTVVYLIDAGHYMRLMTWPNLDLWVVSLALLASMIDGQASGHRSAVRRMSAGLDDSSPPERTGARALVLD